MRAIQGLAMIEVGVNLHTGFPLNIQPVCQALDDIQAVCIAVNQAKLRAFQA